MQRAGLLHKPSSTPDHSKDASFSRPPQNNLPSPSHIEHPLLSLRQSIGNQAVLRMLPQQSAEASTPTGRGSLWDYPRIPIHPPERIAAAQRASFHAASTPPTIQPKLEIGAVADPLEYEADRVGDQVMRMPDPQPQRGATQLDHERLQTKPVQVGETGPIGTPRLVQEVVAGPGQPLDLATRSFMEPRFCFDFSNVRVHSGGTAEQSVRQVGAQAYTVGHHIVFGGGQSAPGTIAGRRLIAHELVHVMQQAGGNAASSSSGGVLQRSPEEPKQADRQKWLEELGRNPQDAHNAWKKLSGPEGAMVLSLMAQRFGWPFAQEFLMDAGKGGLPPGEAFYGRGTGPTAEQLMARRYRLGGYFNTGAADIDVEVWFHPSGGIVRKDVSGRKEAPRAPTEECDPMAQMILDILHDSTARETQIQQALMAEKEQLEKANKTSDDYSAQYDDYVGSLEAMKDRLQDAIDDIETMEQQLVEMNCPAPTIDDQELRNLQIWVDIESGPMGLQFLEPIHAQFKP